MSAEVEKLLSTIEGKLPSSLTFEEYFDLIEKSILDPFHIYIGPSKNSKKSLLRVINWIFSGCYVWKVSNEGTIKLEQKENYKTILDLRKQRYIKELIERYNSFRERIFSYFPFLI